MYFVVYLLFALLMLVIRLLVFVIPYLVLVVFWIGCWNLLCCFEVKVCCYMMLGDGLCLLIAFRFGLLV